MALKRKLGNSEFEALNESLKAEYKKNDKDGMYYLEVDDAHELISALERLKNENKGNADLVASLNRQIEEKQQELARKNGDITGIDKEWKKKLDDNTNRYKSEIQTLQNVAIDGYLQTLLSPVVGMFNLPERHVKRDFAERIQVTFEDGKPVHKIVGKDGNVSEATLDDLVKEFVANPDYSPYIIQSRASGSTSNTSPTGNPGGGNGGKKWSEMTDSEKEIHLANKHKNLQR